MAIFGRISSGYGLIRTDSAKRRSGVIVTVNTDDALMFGIGVIDEFLALYRAGVFTAAELDRIRLNGLTDQPLRP